MLLTDTQIIAPTGDGPLSLAVAKEHLNVYHDEDDQLISDNIAGAVADFESNANVCIRLQTREATFDRFPSQNDWLLIPRRPCTGIVSVKYYDSANVQQTMTVDDYQAVNGFNTRLYVGVDKSWPVTKAGRVEVVAVQYTAGYAKLPDDIFGALKIIVADRYENRGDKAKAESIPPAAERVISLHSTSTPG